MARLALTFALLWTSAACAAGFQINSSFDKGDTDGWSGTIVQGQGFARSAGALRPGTRNKYCAASASRSDWGRGVFQVKAATTITFCYHVNQPASITVMCWSKKRKNNFKVSFDATPREWIIQAVPMGRRGLSLVAGDAVQQISIMIGRAGQKGFEVLLDEICITEGVAPHLLRAYRKQRRRMAAYTFSIHENRMYLNKGMLLSLGDRRRGAASPRKVAVVGDRLARHEKFVEPLLKMPNGLPAGRGYELADKAAYTADGLGADRLVDVTKALLEQEKPEVIFFFVGFDETRAARESYKKAKLGVALGDIDAKEIPDRGALREAYGKALEQIIPACLKSGALPVLLTIPAYSRKGSKKAIIAQELLAVNGELVVRARRHSIPLIDVFGHLEELSKKKGRMVFASGPNAKAWNEINKQVARMYKALEGQLLRPKK